jgi:hypothetical protein
MPLASVELQGNIFVQVGGCDQEQLPVSKYPDAGK